MKVIVTILGFAVLLNTLTIISGLVNCTPGPLLKCTSTTLSSAVLMGINFTTDTYSLRLNCFQKKYTIDGNARLYRSEYFSYEFTKEKTKERGISFTVNGNAYTSDMVMDIETPPGTNTLIASASLPSLPGDYKIIGSILFNITDQQPFMDCGLPSASNQLASWTSGFAALKIALMEAQSAGQIMNLVIQLHPMVLVLAATMLAVTF